MRNAATFRASVAEAELASRRAACSDLIARVKDLEGVPVFVTRILQAIDDPKASPKAVGAEIAKDQAVLAIVLRTANSSYYRSSGQVRDVTEAIVVLGFDTVRQLVFGRLSKQVHRRNDEFQKALWRHSLATAIAAQACARKVKGVTVPHAFTGALLHDVGKGVLHEASPVAYVRLIKEAESDPRPTDEIELERFGTHHADVGAELLGRWSLPTIYRTVAHFHHDPDAAKDIEDKDRRMLAIVSLSDAIALSLGHGPRPGRPIEELVTHPMLKRLGGGRGLLDEMAESVEAELKGLASAFG
jgi:putative nucleotidyltransferase with HDIG domain